MRVAHSRPRAGSNRARRTAPPPPARGGPRAGSHRARRTAPPPPARGGPRAGFTLLEILAVVFLTTLVVAAAIDFFLDLSHASHAAAERTRGDRRATAILDRVARDLEGAFLVVKPEELDPLAHPWLFYAEEQRGDSGADRVKFMSRSHRPRSSRAHESDFEVVAYSTRAVEDGSFDLVRWSSPRMPEGLDRTVPGGEEEGAQVLASGLAGFGLRFLDEDGAWKSSWDSSAVVDSSKLPVAVEIELSLKGERQGADEPEVVGPFSRGVLIPMRPLDLEAALAKAASGDGEEQDERTSCITVNECASKNPRAFPPELVQEFASECASEYLHLVPPSVLLVGCE